MHSFVCMGSNCSYYYNVKCKDKGHPRISHEDPKGESRGIALLFPQSRRYIAVGGQRHAPVLLAPGKNRYLLYRRSGWAPGPAWTGAENLATIGIRSPERPARNESLNRLSYPGPLRYITGINNCQSCYMIISFGRLFVGNNS